MRECACKAGALARKRPVGCTVVVLSGCRPFVDTESENRAVTKISYQSRRIAPNCEQKVNKEGEDDSSGLIAIC